MLLLAGAAQRWIRTIDLISTDYAGCYQTLNIM